VICKIKKLKNKLSACRESIRIDSRRALIIINSKIYRFTHFFFFNSLSGYVSVNVAYISQSDSLVPRNECVEIRTSRIIVNYNKMVAITRTYPLIRAAFVYRMPHSCISVKENKETDVSQRIARPSYYLLTCLASFPLPSLFFLLFLFVSYIFSMYYTIYVLF
jgi:hypothetical protein